MAVKIAKLRAPRNKLYPWSKWTRGKWRVTKGVDFECSVLSFRQSLYKRAEREGLQVRPSVHGDSVDFQFTRRK